MRSRRSVFVLVIVTLIASVLLVAPVASAGEAIECDSDYVKVHDKRIKVLPTGVDDTENLQCALDLAASMPWAKIKLVEGDYYTSFLEVADFFGVIKGAGKHKTTIYTLPEGMDCVARYAEIGEGYPHVLTFASSKVTINGMTFAIGGEAPCAEPWDSFVDPDGFGFEEWSTGVVFATSSLRRGGPCPGVVNHRLRVYDTAFESEFPDFEQPLQVFKNFGTGVFVDVVEPSDTCPAFMKGEVTVRHSDFSGHGGSVVLIATKDSRLTVGGRTPWQANTFDDVGEGVTVVAADGSTAVVKGNHINDVHFWGVLGVAPQPVGERSTLIASENHIRAIDFADGVGVLDFGAEFGEPLIEARIWWNQIELVETPFNGVFVLGSDDGKIIGNRISGIGETGIWLEGIQFFDEETMEEVIIHSSSGWYIARNNVRHLDPYFVDIFLLDSTHENTVKCRFPTDEVFDEGTDNTIIGCTPFVPLELPEAGLEFVEQDVLRAALMTKGHPYAWVQAHR